MPPDDALHPTQSSSSSIDIQMPETTIKHQIGDDPMISDNGMENDIPAESKYESSSGYDASSLVDVDIHSIHGSSIVDSGDENAGSSKKEIPGYNLSGDNDLPMLLSHATVAEIEAKALSGPNAKPGPSEEWLKGAHKMSDIFGETKRRAVKLLKTAKRQLTSSDDDDNGGVKRTEAKSHDKRPLKALKLTAIDEPTGGPVGNSKSAKPSRLLNDQVDNGTFKKHDTKWPRFVESIKELDKDAKFDIDNDPRKVQHSLCMRSQKMHEPYNTSAFKKHIKICTGPTKAAQKHMPPRGVQTLFAMAAANNWSKRLDPPHSKLVELPCPGLSDSNIPSSLRKGFEIYLKRTPVSGGGGPTTDSVTSQLFPGRAYTSLSGREKNEVRSAQQQRYHWKNQADLQKIFSAACCNTVRVQRETHPVPACADCMALVSDKTFKTALSVPLPDDENRKYTPKVLIDHAAIDWYGIISGLRDLIDANENVSQFTSIKYLPYSVYM